MENNSKVVAFVPLKGIFYKGIDIFEYCWREFFKNGSVNIAEILGDKDNIMIPKNIQVSRLNEILRMLEGRFDYSEVGSLDDVFGEDDQYGAGSCDDIFADEPDDPVLDGYNAVEIYDTTGFDAYLTLSELEDSLSPDEDEWTEDEIDEMLNELFADEEE